MERLILVFEDLNEERIDKYIASEVEDMTRSQIQMLIKDNHITVNGNNVKSNYKLKTVKVKRKQKTLL